MAKIPNLTILTEEQVYGDNKLNIFKVIDPMVAVTDTAILRGAYVSDYYVDGNDSLSGRTGYYWLQNSDGKARGVGRCSIFTIYSSRVRREGIRVALPYSAIQSISPNRVIRQDGLERIEYGFYPGMAVSATMQQTLENEYNLGCLTNLGNGCTFDARKYDDYDKSFLVEEQMYYEYNGEKYARIKANSNFGSGNRFQLSNEESYINDDYVWIKVEPIVWLKHPDDDIMVSKNCIISGIRFCDLKPFLNNYLSKDIMFNVNYGAKHNDDAINKTINNFIYVDENNNVIDKKRIIVKSKKKSKI